ncbi:hypothetical protein SteCoe_5438 [Stentor coeruleus]|uniref:Uncharacterized protein n=1 Tax=Stentor coeruleus TaxID=5963 RepID=A0A1R2CS96_9CILI|nr:hypothetical protein SteCoe_5438 [Stentor coeruleus]
MSTRQGSLRRSTKTLSGLFSPKLSISTSQEKYITDISDELSYAEDEEARNALTTLSFEIQKIGNEMCAIKNENILLKEQLKITNNEKTGLLSQYNLMKETFEKEIMELKQLLKQEKDRLKERLNDFELKKQEFEDKIAQIQLEKQKSEAKLKRETEKIKEIYKKALDERDTKINHLKLYLNRTKKVKEKVKSILQPNEELSVRTYEEEPKVKKALHTKSKSYAPSSGKFQQLCKTIVQLEKEQAELRQNSIESSSVKSLMQYNEAKIKELRVLQEELYRSKGLV